MINQSFKWTPNLAYAIGLITADGSLSKDGRHIVLVSTDYCLLEDFQKCLPFETRITNKLPSQYSKKRVYKVQFSNVKFYRFLLDCGLYPNKTYTINELKLPNKYFRDFLRGHLDGDGDILTYTDYYNTYKNPKYIYERLYTRFNSVSKLHMIWLRAIIYKLTDLKGDINKSIRKNRIHPQWRLRFSKKESLILLAWIYYSPNIPLLKRKRMKYINFINKIN